MAAEMWVAIIGAGAAVIGAIISTVSILLTNKNTKNLKLLESSQEVKTSIATKRYEIYQDIIGYINSWEDIEIKFNHNYVDCPALKYLKVPVFSHRFKSRKNIEKELDRVKSLGLNYFYLDKHTYMILCALELYLMNVIRHIYTQEIENFNFFSFIVYCDIGEYVSILADYVNNFIKEENPLHFNSYKKGKNKYSKKLYYKTDFYKIYEHSLLIEKYDTELSNKLKPSIDRYKEKIEEYQKKLNEINNPEIKEQIKRGINVLQNGIKRLENIKHPKKIKYTERYDLSKICSNCDNSKCMLSKAKNLEKKDNEI